MPFETHKCAWRVVIHFNDAGRTYRWFGYSSRGKPEVKRAAGLKALQQLLMKEWNGKHNGGAVYCNQSKVQHYVITPWGTLQSKEDATLRDHAVGHAAIQRTYSGMTARMRSLLLWNNLARRLKAVDLTAYYWVLHHHITEKGRDVTQPVRPTSAELETYQRRRIERRLTQSQ